MNNYSKQREFRDRRPTKDLPCPKGNPLGDREKPLFSFHFLQKGYCITDCNRDEKARFAETLRKLSQLEWMKLKNSQRHGLGCEKISVGAIKEGVPANIPKRDHFLAFRFDGKKPMVGYRENAVFHVLWLDSKFKLYKHE